MKQYWWFISFLSLFLVAGIICWFHPSEFAINYLNGLFCLYAGWRLGKFGRFWPKREKKPETTELFIGESFTPDRKTQSN
jgi:hypothetical protein